MDGVALAKAALLRGHLALITKDDGKFLNPSQCRDIVASLKTQGLLLESQLHGASANTRDQFAQAIEQWCSALQKQLGKTSLGAERTALFAALAGATASSCEAPRLLLNYQAWGTALVDGLKRHRDAALQQEQQGGGSGSHDAIQACCSALTELFTRLQDYVDVAGSGVRRDGSALASRAAGITLPLLSDLTRANSATAATQTAALTLLSSLLATLPTSLRNHYPALESTLASLLVSQNASMGTKLAASRCIAALARVGGDAAAFSVLFRRLLMSAHDAADELFMGLETQPPASYRYGLDSGLPAAAAPDVTAPQPSAQPAQKAGLIPASSLPVVRGTVGAAAGVVGTAAVRVLVDVVGSLMSSMEHMVTGAFPVPVPLPCDLMLRLITRILRFDDGAVLVAKRVPPSSSGFTELQLSLPALHQSAWCLLATVLAATGAAMLPLHASVAKLLNEHLRKVWALGPGALAAIPPAVRAALFHATRAACQARGGVIGVGRLVAGDALGAASVELYGWMPAVAAAGAGSRAGQPPAAKKAKYKEQQEAAVAAADAAAAAAAASGAAATVAAGSEGLKAQLAAIGMLQCIAASVGPLLAPIQRAQLDSMAFHAAAAAGEAAQHAVREPDAVTAAQANGVGALQAAAFRLLLATLLAPSSHRPPYLSQAVLLFSKGRSQASPIVSALSASACAQLEGLLHPRSLPINGVPQGGYPAHSEVQALPRPRMWSSLDAKLALLSPSRQHPPATAAAAVAVPPAPATARTATQVQQAGQTGEPAAPAASVPEARPALFQGGSVGFGATAAFQPAPAAGAAPVVEPLALAPVSLFGTQTNTHVRDEPAATRAAPETAQPVPSPAAPAKDTPVVLPTRPDLMATDESSDSEGSLPDLDSGDDDSDSESSD